METWKNQLYFGDNLDILRGQHIPAGSVDLIYLDPPFNSNATYNVLFAEKSGEKSAAQITAFEDTWQWGQEAEGAYRDVVTLGPRKLADLLQALRAFLGQNNMMAYLTMMAVRLVDLHRVLKPTGSLYLHCDPTASHYLKMVLDAIFGPKNFINEIVWRRAHPKGHASKRFARNHDVILSFAKDSNRIKWNPQYGSYNAERVSEQYTLKDEEGRIYQLTSLLNPNPDRPNLTYEFLGITKVWRWTKERMMEELANGRIVIPRDGKGIPRYKRYLDEQKGIPVDDFWSDIDFAAGSERLGYPTQKPEALLERIIQASSNEGDLVLDPFCGCGTALNVAERLKRRWIGIDVTHLAITLIKQRLHHTFDLDLAPFEVIGEPADVLSAEALALANRHQFEWWALGRVDARPARDKKKGADSGIDGVIYFDDDNSGNYKKVLIQVKSGGVKAGDIRDLKGVLDREKAAIGAFLTLKPPTKPMREEAASAGFYEPVHFPGQRYPRLQILTIAELFAGKELQYPHFATSGTFKKAARQHKGLTPKDKQGELL
ncbi:MAG: site-specific DNA-methyltransferase [Desulfobaccales bacterium]